MTPSHHQDELPFRTVLSHELFPGRSSLLIAEVADALRCTVQHVLDLVEEGDLRAVDIRGRIQGEARPSDFGRRDARRCLRIPVSAYDDFIRRRAQ